MQVAPNPDGGSKPAKKKKALIQQVSRENIPLSRQANQTDTSAVEKVLVPQINREDTPFLTPNKVQAAHNAQDLDQAIQAAQRGETVRPASWSAQEDGLEAWDRETDRFVTQSQKDSTARDGVWQEPSVFEDYRRQQNASIARLQEQASRYRNFFDSHRDVYGDEKVDSILGRLDRGGKSLSGLSSLLREEETYLGQFSDQREFDTYQRLSRADAEELKQWNEELGEEIRTLRSRYVGDREGAKRELERIQQTRNQVLARYYELDNRGKLAALEQDPAAKALYTQADAKTGDADDMLRRMRDRLDRGGRPEDDPTALAAIEQVYGLSPSKSGSLTQYMNDLQSISGLPEGETGTLAGMGYDYNRLARYQQTQRDAARYAKEQEQTRQAALKHPVLASGVSVLSAPVQAVDYIDMAARALVNGSPDNIAHYEPLNVYNMGATNLVSGIRGTVAEQIEDKTKGMELLGRNVPSFLYQTGMSMADSAAQVGLLGGASLPFMGGAAAANQMQDIIARGGNNTQALLGSAAAGAAEMLFEKFSVESLLKPKSVTGWKSLLKETAKQAGTEATEEVFTEVANILSDAAIMGADSSAELAVRAYMAQGMSEEEARKQVFFDQIGQVAEAGAGGALSGGIMGGATSAVNWALGGGRSNSVEAMQYQNREGNPQPAPFKKGVEGQADPLVQTAREMAGQEEFPRPFGLPPFNKGGEGQKQAEGTRAAALDHEGRSNALQQAAENPQPAPPAQTAPFEKGALRATEEQGAGGLTAQQRTRTAMENASALVKASEVFGENGRKAFAAAWDGQGDSAKYYAGFAAWYQAGLTGKAENQVRGLYAGSINEAQKIAAYSSGQRDAEISLAKEKAAAPYAKTAGTEAGLVYDAYVAGAVEGGQATESPLQPANGGSALPPLTRGALTAQTAERINTVAKALGVRVRMVDSVAESRANGQYSGSDILIAKDAENPVAQVFGHEITHRVQELAPEQYRVFRQAAMDNMADSATQAKIDNYRTQGENILYEAAMDDVAADYAGQLLESGAVLDEFIDRHREDRTLLQKLRDAFRGLWQKLTGVEKRKAQTAEGKLSAALDAAAEQAGASAAQTAPFSRGPLGAEGGAKYSLKEFKDGRRFVDVDTDQAQFDGLSRSEKSKLATKIIKQRFLGKVIGTDNPLFVNRDTAEEYGHPAKRLAEPMHSAKMQAATELDNLVDAGDNHRTSPDGQYGHTHAHTTGDYEYYDVIFKVGSDYYSGVINVENNVRGRRLKDITQIKNVTQGICSSYGETPQTTSLRDGDITSREVGQVPTGDTAATANDVVKDTIPQSGEESKAKYSLKGATITKTYNQLLKENDALREWLDYWRGQTRTTKEVTTDKKAVNKAARTLVENYGAQMDAGDLSGRLQALYDHMARTWYANGEVENSDVWRGAEEIARDIAGSAVAEWSLADEFPGLKEKLRDTPITISREYDGDIRNENFRRDYRGKLKLSSQGPTNVDAVYSELAESYPGLFPTDITHPADQMEQIMSVADELSRVEQQDRFSGQMEEAVTGITNEIVEQFLALPLTRATFADQQAMKLDKLRAEKNMKLDELRAENKEAVRNAIARERAVRERQIKALKDRHAQGRKDAAGRRADSKARDRLLHIVKRLQNEKLPEVNRTLLNEYIGDLDTVAKSMTGKNLEKLTNLRDWYSEQKSNNPDFIVDPKIEHDLERLSKRQIGDLSAQEVADLTQVLLNIENEIRTQRKLIDSQERRDVYAAGETAIRDIEASAGSKPTGIFAFLDKNIVTETLSPLRQVRRMTGYVKDSPLTKVTQELADGQRAMYAYQMKAEQQFSKYTNDKGFTKSFAGPKAKGIKIQGIGKDGPVTVTITPAMRASLYLHSLNDQNLKHIRDGGITVPDWKLYQKGQTAEAYARGTTIRLTPSQVRSITANMTQKERAFAMAAHRYFNVTSKEAVNAVSEKLKGYSLAQVENYFPINTDSSFTRAEFESIKRDGTIEGMGFLKERVNAANPVLLRDMGDVLDQSIQMHSKYVGLAIPVRNFNKLWNVTTGQWVETGADADGQSVVAAKDRFEYTDSVQKAVKSKWGETGYSYIEKMMSDLQNGHGPTKTWAKAMSKLRSNYAGAVLTLNGSVAMKQAASYPTAAAVLGWGPLAKAMKSFGKVDLDLIAKYTPLQWYRSKGFSTQELGDMRSANRQLPKVLNWVQGVDLITTRKLWKASEYYVQANNETLNRGSDAYYKAVADIYNQVIEETQPNYTTMQRPQLLRSDDSLLANLQMFKTQPFQNFNILYDAAGEMTAAMRRGDKVEIKQARTKAGRAVTSQLAQLAVFAGMGMAWAMFRGKKKKYEDEEGELTLQSAMSALGKDMVGGALAGIPFGSDAWELLSSKLFRDSYYGMDAVTVQALSDTIQSLDGMEKLIEDTIRSASAGDKIDWRSAGIKLDGYIDDISKAVPYENVANLVYAIQRQVAVQSLGELQGEYAAMKVTVDPEKKSGEYYDLLYKALEQGDLDSYFTIREELPELLGKDNSGIDGAMKSRYKDKLEKDAAYSLSQRAYDLLGIRPKLDDTEKEAAFSPDDLDSKTHQSFQEQRADRWREAAAKLEGNSLYGKLSNADKDKAMNAAWEYAHQTALAEASGGKYKPTSEWIGKAKEAAKRGVQPWEYALYKTAYGTDAAYKALEKGNLDEYRTLRGEYMDVLGKDGPSIDEAMRDKYKEKGGSLPQTAMDLIGIHPTGSGSGDDSDSFGADDLERAAYDAYTSQRAADYRAMIDRVTSDPLYQAAMEKIQSDALADMYTIADKNALVSASDGQYVIPQNYNWIDKARGLEEYGLDSADYVLYRLALRMADEANAENSKVGSYTNDEVKTALSQLDIPWEAKSYLWLAQGKNAKTNPYK